MKGKKTLMLRCMCCEAWNEKRYPKESALEKNLEKLENHWENKILKKRV